jgi:acyl-CoA synthetase (AMP-forming)/AMP-acid ligase II
MIDQKFNIAFDLFKFLNENPKQICFESDNGIVNGGQFAIIITNFALHLLSRDIKPRDLIGLDIDDPIIALTMTQAIGAIGASWVKITQQSLEAELPIKHVIYNTKRMYHGASVYEIDKSWFMKPEKLTNDLQIRGYKDPNDLWMMAQSSGSTGLPKFIPITFKQNWHRVHDMNINMFDLNTRYFFTLFMPLKTSAQYHSLSAIFRKIPVLINLTPEKLVTYPKVYMIGSIMQTYKFINMIEQPDAPYEITSESSGAAMTKIDLEKFLKYFNKVVSAYGATETTRTHQKTYTEIGPSDLGEPLFNDIIAEIVDNNDQPVADDVVGILRFKETPRHVKEYYNDPEETAEKFKNGYFYPGDLARKDAEGKIFIVGRKNSTMLNIGGIKIDPTAIEADIKSIEHVNDCLIFKNSNLSIEVQLSAFIVAAVEHKKIITSKVSEIIGTNIGISHVPKTIYFVKSIPLNDNGKPWRAAAERIAEQLNPDSQIFQLTE